MVSRSFLVTQACLNALQEKMPVSVRHHGAAATWKYCAKYFLDDEVPDYWLVPIRKHFDALYHRERFNAPPLGSGLSLVGGDVVQLFIPHAGMK